MAVNIDVRIEEQAASVELPQQPESELAATGDQALSAEASAPASMAMQVQRNLQITQRTDGVAVVGEIDNFSAIDVDGSLIEAQGPTDTLYMESGRGITLEVVDGRLVVGATGGGAGLDIEVVQQLPQTGDSGTLYLVPNQGSGDNIYDEYVWLEASQAFEMIGTTEIDLSGYVTDAELTTALAGKADSADLDDYLPLAGGTLTGDLEMGADLVYGSDTAYPTFVRSTWSTSSDEATLPVTPCFVLDTSDNGLYWCSGSEIKRLNLVVYGLVKSGSDLDSQKPGETWWGNNFTNSPYTGWFQVMRIGDYQIAFGFTSNTTAPAMYVRSFVNGVLQPWVRCDGAEYLPLSGGIMTGAINMRNTEIDRDAANPSSKQYGQKMVRYFDKDDEVIGYIQPVRETDGRIGLQITPVNEKSDGTNAYGAFTVYVDKSGNMSYLVNNPANFRSAISAVSKAGDTLTGYIKLKNSNINRDTANPSSDQRGLGFSGLDADEEVIFDIMPVRRANGRIDLGFYARNETTSGGAVENVFLLRVDRAGSQTYYVSNAANFRSAIGAAASSDRRLKSDISPLGEDAVEFIEALEPCVYTINGERQVGLIAQDVHEVDPWGTRMAFETQEDIDGLDEWERMDDGSPTWKLDYIRVVPPLVQAVKDCMARIDELEAEVAQLKAERAR